ncbi:hypothetical protein B566_EDAN005155 [Ephemera danica]|nr:hypothetical protein B566_EDAN005155 [Ephemera danica]
MSYCCTLCRDNMSKEEPKGQATGAAPGEGLRSLRTTTLFRLTNFELYAKPNVVIMGLGILGLSISVGYMMYMRSQYEKMGLYTAVDDSGQQVNQTRPMKAV